MTEPQEGEHTPEAVPEPPIDMVPFIRRKMAWDMIPHDEVMSIFPLLGLAPASEEGVATEHMDSHVRTMHLEFMREIIRVYSALSAEILGVALIRDTPEHPVSEEQRQMFNQQNFTFINTACYAIMAQLFDDGRFGVQVPVMMPPGAPTVPASPEGP